MSLRPRSIKGEQIGSELQFRRDLVDLSKTVSAEPVETRDSERGSNEMGYYCLPQQKVGLDLDEARQDTTQYPVSRVSLELV